MAGDWIKMRTNLWDDPRVARLVDATNSTEAAVVGALYWLWATADQHTEDGIMPGLSLRQVDRKTGVQGFGEALCAIGWLADHPEGVRVIDFEKHNGSSAKKRCQTAKRVAAFKDGSAGVTQPDENANADSVTKSLAVRDLEKIVDKEKIKKEEKKDTSASLAPSGVSPSVWEDFLKIRRAKKSPMNNTALLGIQREAEKAGVTLEQALMTCCERGWAGFKAQWVETAAVNTYAQAKADVGKVTVAENPDVLATRLRLEADAAIPRNGPTLEILAQMAALRGRPGAMQ